jgi:hypothetical protein
LSLTYFFLSTSCHKPSSLKSLNNHLLSKHLFWTSKSKIPSPPCTLAYRVYSILPTCTSFCAHHTTRKT